MPTSSGPLTKDTTTLVLGLAQIRVAAYSSYIGQVRPILPSSKSIGSLADTKFMSNVEFYKHESGFPLQEDATFALRESCALECSFHEITPANMALARGLNPDNYSDEHKGVIRLGNLSTPVRLRVEAVYTFPDGTNYLYVIFPRAQVVASTELEFSKEEPAASPVRIEAKRADSGASEGNVAWDDKPYGWLYWDDGTQTTTSTTTTTTAP